ncbi:MAG: hypothetical protein JNM90_09250 [Burkholderiales bacterium]|nr:hypothetical protein [Burkholderiales bacterium]
MKRTVLALALAAGLLVRLAPAAANPSDASAASVLSSAVVLAGAGALAHGSGQFVVTALETVGESTVVVLRDAAGAATASLQVAGALAGGASLAVGSAVEVVSQASGQLLVASGRVIAFLPNELGRALVGSSPTADRR